MRGLLRQQSGESKQGNQTFIDIGLLSMDNLGAVIPDLCYSIPEFQPSCKALGKLPR